MGVQVTAQARTELTSAGTASHVNAQTAMAQGIYAQRQGTQVAALSYFYQASAFDSSLLEAASRATVVSANISSGNIGVNVRNDIQRRNEWKKTLDEAEAFFKAHLPFEIKMLYGSSLIQIQGSIDYQRGTVGLSCSLEVRPTDGFKVLEVIRKGLIETGKMEEWGFAYWPLQGSDMFIPPAFGESGQVLLPISIVVGLFDEQGKQLSSTAVNIRNIIRFYSFHEAQRMGGPLPKGYFGYYNGAGMIEGVIVKETYTRVVDTSRFAVGTINTEINFSNVNANDITDNLVVKIISVNGIDAETAGSTGYIKISTTQ
jgi:hypothetical protein